MQQKRVKQINMAYKVWNKIFMCMTSCIKKICTNFHCTKTISYENDNVWSFPTPLIFTQICRSYFAFLKWSADLPLSLPTPLPFQGLATLSLLLLKVGGVWGTLWMGGSERRISKGVNHLCRSDKDAVLYFLWITL